MKTLFFSLVLLLSLVPEQGIGQSPGSVSWTRFTDPDSNPYDWDTIRSVQVQVDGKIVAAGNSYSGKAIALGRFNGTGVPDPSFGSNGIVLTQLDSAYVSANAVAMQSDGKIVVAGSYKKGTVGDFIVVRYKPDGSFDSSFGTNGIVLTDINIGSFDVATALAIQTNGKIVVAGRSNSLLSLGRYNSNGSLDSSFDSDGKLTSYIAGAPCMKLQANGKIVVGCDSVVTRLNTDGSPDQNFGVNGLVFLSSYARSMTVQNDGKLLIAGRPFQGRSYYVLERLDTAGVHDNSFGSSGISGVGGFKPGASNPNSFATAVCVQTDGRILVSGWTQYCILGDCRDFAVARFKSNGKLDSSFGSNGLVSTYIPNSQLNQSYAATVTPNNELVVAGGSGSLIGLDAWELVSYYLGPPLGVNTVLAARQLTVTPNPTEDFVRIQAANIENRTWSLSLCDLTGRMLFSEIVFVKNNALDKTISLLGLPAAMYLVKLHSSSGEMTLKLMKSR